MGNNNDKFMIDLKTGEIGEVKTIEYLQKENFTQDIVDVRDNKFWRDNDVDFILICKNGDLLKIEVKTDTQAHLSKNIVYEYMSNKHYKTKGCFEKTKCDVMFYYLSEIDKLYYINMYNLREYIKNEKDNLREVNMGDYALGYLLRIKKMLELEIMFEINNF